MKTKQLNKIESFQNFYKVMENNLMKWTNTGQLKVSYDRFVRNLKKLNDLKEDAQMDLSGVKEKLNKSRTDLNEKFIPVLNLVKLYATDNKKKGLKKKVDKIRKRLDGISDDILEDRVDEITTMVEKKLEMEPSTEKGGARLENYGINLQIIEQLKNENMVFSELKNSLGESREKVKNAKKEISKRIKENEKIIKRRINKFMSIYKLNDPDFYKAYKDALYLKKTGKTSKTRVKTEPSESITQTKIPRKTSKGVKRKTVAKSTPSPDRKTTSGSKAKTATRGPGKTASKTPSGKQTTTGKKSITGKQTAIPPKRSNKDTV